MILSHLLRHARIAAGIAAAAPLAAAAPAAASVHNGYERAPNWAGYQATGAVMDQVSGSWIEPRVRCTKAIPVSSVAVWVGLGDPVRDGNAGAKIEQIATTETCTWHQGKTSEIGIGKWEFWPGPPSFIFHAAAPGDRLRASVSISGDRVTMTLRDETRHWEFVKHLSASVTDERSAEWIVENLAPKPGERSPLVGFSPVTFTNAQAHDAAGASGAIDAPQWSANKVALLFGRPTRLRAWPSPLNAGGTAFTVTAADRPPPL